LIVLAWLEKYCSKDKLEWKMIAAKAIEWVKL
jgi:hypothetical protein